MVNYTESKKKMVMLTPNYKKMHRDDENSFMISPYKRSGSELSANHRPGYPEPGKSQSQSQSQRLVYYYWSPISPQMVVQSLVGWRILRLRQNWG